MKPLAGADKRPRPPREEENAGLNSFSGGFTVGKPPVAPGSGCGRELDTSVSLADNPVVVALGVPLMTPAHRIEVVLLEDGKLLLDHLPFRAGQAVEVIIFPATCPPPPGNVLKGAVLRYDQPTDPVAEADWGSVR